MPTSRLAPPQGPTLFAGGRAPAYRVEHRLGDAVAVLAHSDDPLARYTVLTPLAVRLLDARAAGMLGLVEQATGDVLARWALGPGAVDPGPWVSAVE